MKIALVTSWPPRHCGIATYSRKLLAGLRIAGPEHTYGVVAEEGGEGGAEEVAFAAVWRRGTDFAAPIVHAVVAQGARVAHVQHAPDLMGMGGLESAGWGLARGRSPFFAMLDGLRAAGVRTVVTLHSVYTTRAGLLERLPLARGFHRRLADRADALIVHTDACREILARHGVPRAQISVIAHGTDEPERGDPARGRSILGLPDDARTLLFFGFVHAQKNVHVLLPALARLARRVPQARLVVAGKPGGDAWYNHLYLKGLRARARQLGLADRVSFVSRFIDDAAVLDIHAAAQVVALPYSQAYASASGVVHGAMAMGIPLLCADGPKFEEVATQIDAALCVPAHRPAAWAAALERLLSDDAWRAAVIARMRAYADRTRWPRIGAAHHAVYGG